MDIVAYILIGMLLSMAGYPIYDINTDKFSVVNALILLISYILWMICTSKNNNNSKGIT